MHKKIIALLISFLFLITIIPITVSSDESKSIIYVDDGGGADLKIIDFELTNFNKNIFGELRYDTKIIIKNVGNDTYTGGLEYKIKTYPIVPLDIVCIVNESINNSEDFSLVIGEELTHITNEGVTFGRMFFPYFYYIIVELHTEGDEIGDGNFRAILFFASLLIRLELINSYVFD
jgi:hypothetical protein